jgi:hypothetical protein
MDWPNDTESWGLLFGVVAPLAIAVVQQPTWSPAARWVVGWLCAVMVGILTCLAKGTIDEGDTVLRTVAVVLVASQATYAGWRHGPAALIERVTSPSGPRGG